MLDSALLHQGYRLKKVAYLLATNLRRDSLMSVIGCADEGGASIE